MINFYTRFECKNSAGEVDELSSGVVRDAQAAVKADTKEIASTLKNVHLFHPFRV